MISGRDYPSVETSAETSGNDEQQGTPTDMLNNLTTIDGCFQLMQEINLVESLEETE